jgi:hypothetical protein
MLYLHGGFPGTGTTSLQAALFRRRELFARSGIVFPDRWRNNHALTHHGLAAMLDTSLKSEDSLDDFKRYLTKHADQDLLFSAEALTFSLAGSETRPELMKLLSISERTMPVRIVFTLRGFDEFLNSQYLRVLRKRVRSPGFVNFMEKAKARHAQQKTSGLGAGPHLWDQIFAGLRQLEQGRDESVSYIKYEFSGDHNEKLLGAIGLDGGLAQGIRDELRGSRRNPRLSHKQTVVLIDLEAISARADVDFDRMKVLDAFQSGKLKFEGDTPCWVLDQELRRQVHESALESADALGVTAYVDFFSDRRLSNPHPECWDASLLTDADVERMVTFFRSRE